MIESYYLRSTHADLFTEVAWSDLLSLWYVATNDDKLPPLGFRTDIKFVWRVSQFGGCEPILCKVMTKAEQCLALHGEGGGSFGTDVMVLIYGARILSSLCLQMALHHP